MTSSDYSSDVCRDNIIKNNANDVNIFILNESQDIDTMLFKSSERHFRYTFGTVLTVWYDLFSILSMFYQTCVNILISSFHFQKL